MAQARRGKKPQHGNLMLVSYSLVDDDEPPHYHFDLTVEEFASIGLVIMQWSYLEYALYMRTRAIAKRTKTPMPKDATNSIFRKRLRAFDELVDMALKRKRTKDYYKTLVPQIANAAGDRHRLTHHLWSYNPRNPTQLWITRAKKGARFKPLDMQRICKFAESIGALSFALMNPPFHGGREPSGPFSYVSRRFLLMLQGTRP